MIKLADIITADTWITSDHHWGHDNIRKFQNRPWNHFELMRERWIETVAEDDTVLHLGDLVCYAYRREESPESWIEGLPGKKFIILGNHDKYKTSWYERNGFSVVGRGDKPFMWNNICFSHEPLDGDWRLNIHGHTHLNNPPRPGKVNVSIEATDYRPVRLRDII